MQQSNDDDGDDFIGIVTCTCVTHCPRMESRKPHLHMLVIHICMRHAYAMIY